MFDVSRAEDDGTLGAFGDDVAVFGLSCHQHSGRHDDGEPVDAEK